MELFLNLCWLALVLPAYLLWRQRHPSDRSASRSLLIIGALGCAVMLLFPVISASDDLHATAQAIEESKHSLRALRAGPAHCAIHASPFVAKASACLHAGLEQLGIAQLSPVHPTAVAQASNTAGRSPPVAL